MVFIMKIDKKKRAVRLKISQKVAFQFNSEYISESSVA
jgi:hypothetical protein